MPLIAPDLLADMRDLPPAALGVLVAVGLLIWSSGWWTHRFWLVLATTFGAGLAGLRWGPDLGIQSVAAGLLAAIAAGCLALSLARVAVFTAYGLACWYLMQLFQPQWAIPAACILAGGLLSMVFYRLSLMLLTSGVGMLLTAYGGLVLAERFIPFDAVRWVTGSTHTVEVAYLAGVFVGVVIQYWIERSRRRYRRWQEHLEELREQRRDLELDGRVRRGWFSGRRAG
jgi:hypothetical protein